MYKIYNEDSFKKLDELEENSIDAIVTDPPYGLTSGQKSSKGFMGKEWDGTGIERNPEFWAKCLRVLKPGGYLLSFAGSRTYHKIAYAIEESGFEIKDMFNWVYGSGMPKGLNIGLAIDKKMGVESKVVGIGKSGAASTHTRTMHSQTKDGKDVFGGEFKVKEAQNGWKGWNTAIKPSHEPIVVAQKPFKGTFVDNILNWKVGAFNIDECRVDFVDENDYAITANKNQHEKFGTKPITNNTVYGDYSMLKPKNYSSEGRYPANTILSYDENDRDEVCGGFPDTKSVRAIGIKRQSRNESSVFDNENNGLQNREYNPTRVEGYNDCGSAARYFKNCPYTKDELMEIRSYYYSAKASKKDRDEGLDSHNTHATIKPTELCQYLVRLVTPKGGVVLDPFMGSGSTGKACMMENAERNAGYKFVGIEKEKEYYDIAKARIDYVINKYGLGE